MVFLQRKVELHWHDVAKAYFARFHSSKAAAPPPDGLGWVYLSSSPPIERLIRF